MEGLGGGDGHSGGCCDACEVPRTPGRAGELAAQKLVETLCGLVPDPLPYNYTRRHGRQAICKKTQRGGTAGLTIARTPNKAVKQAQG